MLNAARYSLLLMDGSWLSFQRHSQHYKQWSTGAVQLRFHWLALSYDEGTVALDMSAMVLTYVAEFDEG